MKRTLFVLAVSLAMLFLTGCQPFIVGKTGRVINADRSGLPDPAGCHADAGRQRHTRCSDRDPDHASANCHARHRRHCDHCRRAAHCCGWGHPARKPIRAVRSDRGCPGGRAQYPFRSRGGQHHFRFLCGQHHHHHANRAFIQSSTRTCGCKCRNRAAAPAG